MIGIERDAFTLRAPILASLSLAVAALVVVNWNPRPPIGDDRAVAYACGPEELGDVNSRLRRVIEEMHVISRKVDHVLEELDLAYLEADEQRAVERLRQLREEQRELEWRRAQLHAEQARYRAGDPPGHGRRAHINEACRTNALSKDCR